MSRLTAIPITISEAKNFVTNFHRHNKAPVSGLFAVAASNGQEMIGVAIVGRPISRFLDDGRTAEVTRLCVIENSQKGACSFLYMKCWAAAKALGWEKLITYTLQEESGSSLRGAGWKIVAELKEKNSGGWQNRPGRDWQAVVGQSKFRWEISA